MFEPRRAAVAAVVLALSGCATTTFQSTWKAPDATTLDFAGEKVVALIVNADTAVRRGAEHALANKLTRLGCLGIPAYTAIPDEVVKDKDKAKAWFEKQNVAGVVVMQVSRQEKELTASGPLYAGPTYGGFYGGWYGWGWGAAYSPGNIRTDTLVFVETLVYSLKQDKLVWAGQSKTTNPEKVHEFIDDLVDHAAAEMKKAGLIRKRS